MITNHCTYFGNPWVGMFVRSTDEITLLPLDSTEKLKGKAEDHLRTELLEAKIGDSPFLGSYIAMNKNGAVLPNIASDDEMLALKKAGLNVVKSAAKFNAHGNNICVNDRGGIINPHIPARERTKMEDALGVELVACRVAGFSTVGSCTIATDRGFLAHYRAEEDDMKCLEDALKVKGSRGTVNMGLGFVSLGIVANGKGYIAGEKTSAHELGRAEEALGFLDK